MSTAVLVAEAPRERNVWGVIAKTFLQAFLIGLGIGVLYPRLWMAFSGFKNNAQSFGNPFA